MRLCEESWLFFQYLTNRDKRKIINDILENEDEIAMAGETLINISRDEIEQARITSELKYYLDTKSFRIQAERAEKRADTKAIEIARKLKAAGVSADIIYETTGVNP